MSQPTNRFFSRGTPDDAITSVRSAQVRAYVAMTVAVAVAVAVGVAVLCCARKPRTDH